VFRRTLLQGFDTRRLRWLLLALFAALALPTALLVWQARGQLRWEAYHQYRGSAEALTESIDARLAGLIAGAERRPFAEFAFLLEPPGTAGNVVQRSPLSNYPVDAELPGLIGYFQVDSDGRFSSPLLPASGALATELGMDAAEYAARRALADDIHAVLADNRLVRRRESVAKLEALQESALLSPAPAGSQVAAEGEAYSQQMFDELRRGKRAQAEAAPDEAAEAGAPEAAAFPQQRNVLGKVSDIPLDASLEARSARAERDSAAFEAGNEAVTPARQVADSPAAPAAAASGRDDELREDADASAARGPIRTFASEVDPYEFSVLDSGHIVLFRNVWREGGRYVQGLLIDGQRFVAEAIGATFLTAGLADRSSLIVAWDDDVIATFTDGTGVASYTLAAEDLGGALLYRSRLSAPLDRIELIYSVQELPPGPGARVLGWLSLVLALVFLSGFTILYRLGAGQIRLARQQQDFVSAVSHELKTPLTSIRMYGEMLMQGWADEPKRQVYYRYIHDEAERLSRLIGNVLRLASITRNAPQLSMKRVSVRELCSEVESRIASQVGRAGFELRVTTTPEADAAAVEVDVDCFLQVLINLVDNALKFSRNAATRVVELGCRTLGGNKVQFSVRDYGPGVPRDQMQKIFELFYRSESELTRETVGTGIGLAIVHELTLAMNGAVDLVNAEPGAEFRVVFPQVGDRPRT
jgi:two-component system phosphate regulon sensor histidine kinase PhoR